MWCGSLRGKSGQDDSARKEVDICLDPYLGKYLYIGIEKSGNKHDFFSTHKIKHHLSFLLVVVKFSCFLNINIRIVDMILLININLLITNILITIALFHRLTVCRMVFCCQLRLSTSFQQTEKIETEKQIMIMISK